MYVWLGYVRATRCAALECDCEHECVIVCMMQGNSSAPPSNAIFDFSGHFLLYPTLAGIKVVNLETNRVCRLLGSGESNERFLALAMFQGTPKVGSQFKVTAKTGSGAPMSGDAGPQPDPTVFAAAFKRSRFYLLSRREPSDGESMHCTQP